MSLCWMAKGIEFGAVSRGPREHEHVDVRRRRSPSQDSRLDLLHALSPSQGKGHLVSTWTDIWDTVSSMLFPPVVQTCCTAKAQ